VAKAVAGIRLVLVGLSLAVPAVSYAGTNPPQQSPQVYSANSSKAFQKQQKKSAKARQKALKAQQKSIQKYKKLHGVQH
jgi:hypothetical protein